MSEIRIKSQGAIKLFESDNTSHVTIASPASLSANRTITIPDADVTLGSGVSLSGSTNNQVTTVTGANAITGESGLIFDGSKLGIGTSTMTRTLNVTDTASGASTGIQLIGANNGTQFINFGDTDDSNVGEINYDHSTNKMLFRANDAYEMSLFNGVVGMGANASSADLGVGLHIKTADSGASVNSDADQLVIEGSTGATGMSILSATNGSGDIYFGDSGNNAAGFIQYNHSSNYMRFGTTAATERVRIASDGEFFIGSSTSTNSKLMVTQAENKALARFHNTDSSAGATLFKIKCDNSSGGNYTSFNIDRAGNSALNIEGDGDVKNTNNSYGAISDERIKKDITDAKSQWNDIKALKIKNYKLKTDSNSSTQLGVIAQDLETDGMGGLVKNSRPEAYLVNSHSDFGTVVDGTADNGATPIKDDDGKITGYEDLFTEGQKVKSVKYSVLYMKAIKALQEAMAKIETLETKVTALENA